MLLSVDYFDVSEVGMLVDQRRAIWIKDLYGWGFFLAFSGARLLGMMLCCLRMQDALKPVAGGSRASPENCWSVLQAW